MEDLFKEVLKLIKLGYGRSIIERELGLSQKKTENMIKLVRQKYPNLPKAGQSRNRELHIDKGHNTHPPKVKKKDIKKALMKKKNEDKIEELEKLGMGCRQISSILQVPENTVSQKILRNQSKPKRLTRAMLLEEKLLETEDMYDLCKSMSTSPKGLKQLISKKEGTFNPAGSTVKKLVHKGARYSDLQREFGSKLSLIRAKEILLDNYPKHFIVETRLPDGDLLLTPIKDSSDKIEWMLGSKLKRDFEYYVNDEENYMTVKFDKSLPGKEISIFNITDIHIGSKAFRKDLLLQVIDYIKNDPMSFFVIGGDTIEFITRVSVGEALDQYENINEQVVEAVKLFKPIAHKLIAVMYGNHCSGRGLKAAQVDIARMMAQMLQAPYFEVRTTIDLFFRGVNKRLSLTHNYGKAIQMHQVVAEVKKLVSSMGYHVDCFMSGHSHQAWSQDLEVTMLVPGQGYYQQRYYVINGGSFVRHTGTYAEKALFTPMCQDVSYFTFDDKNNHNVGLAPIDSI